MRFMNFGICWKIGLNVRCEINVHCPKKYKKNKTINDFLDLNISYARCEPRKLRIFSSSKYILRSMGVILSGCVI